MKCWLFVTAIITSLPQASNGQAFGVSAGDAVSKYGGTFTGGKSKYYFRITVPLPNSEFESYNAVSTIQTGICKVIGIGRDHTDSYGNDLRSSFKRIRSALDEKYGSSQEYDFLRSKSVWKDLNEFNWSIFKEERTLAAFWTSETTKRLPDTLTNVMLDTKAVNSNATYLTIGYEFSNFSQCKKIMDNFNDRGL